MQASRRDVDGDLEILANENVTVWLVSHVPAVAVDVGYVD